METIGLQSDTAVQAGTPMAVEMEGVLFKSSRAPFVFPFCQNILAEGIEIFGDLLDGRLIDIREPI